MGLRSPVIAAGAAWLLGAWPAGLGAQTSDVRCREAGESRNVADIAEDRACNTLANYVVAVAAERLRGLQTAPAVSPRSLQSTRREGSASGGLGQDAAVSAPLPTALAGGTLTATGSEAGARTLAAISVNPAMFIANPSDSAAAARLSRLLDLSVLVPLGGMDDDADGTLDYFGLRLRVNVTGAAHGARLMRQVEAAARGLVENEQRLVEVVEARLHASSNPGACTDALLDETLDDRSVERACGGPVTLSLSAADEATLRAVLNRAREEADASYIGLDVRLDHGDPTLGAVPDASGTFLFGGVALGRTTGADGGGTQSGLRFRAGVRYADLDSSGETLFAADGAAGFEMRRVQEGTELNLSAGLEARFGGDAALRAAAQTDYLMFRLALRVPFGGAEGISLAYATPLVGAGHMSPVLSVGFNWALLLPGGGGSSR